MPVVLVRVPTELSPTLLPLFTSHAPGKAYISCCAMAPLYQTRLVRTATGWRTLSKPDSKRAAFDWTTGSQSFSEMARTPKEGLRRSDQWKGIRERGRGACLVYDLAQTPQPVWTEEGGLLWLWAVTTSTDPVLLYFPLLSLPAGTEMSRFPCLSLWVECMEKI